MIADRLGIFARTFVRDSPDQVAAEVAKAGYPLAHWNFAAIGLPTLATAVDESVFLDVRRAFTAARAGIPSISATYNVIHPDAVLRARQTRDAVRLIGLAPLLGADVVTLCTGTRDPLNMWRAHPGNDDPDAWSDLRYTLDPLLTAAAITGVRLGVEPEPGNVIRDAPTAARLLKELGDDAPIGIVLDPANLLTPQTVSRQDEIIGEAIDLLGDRVIGAQAKDVVAEGYSAAGAGLMNYPALLSQLDRVAPVPLIVQDASESDAARVRTDLIRWAER
ncbi:sugar phosphate isomerase/epimerase [Actinoplanes sp. TBRC 11911]|uniref:sugar phosphate isomerase/epimerase family protein n=1 Tax=Actinoplanes sp. TBRC 11911 TaxID=2729386 RepID=UPI00145CBCDA|nr:sugar phosphate isomerase/epimerase [Actinoplanes sp. TBRC 11911]NMO51391.1 sugar phosphate isomerase/epimerase [Actinoplanes sp. TBRC 11911]